MNPLSALRHSGLREHRHAQRELPKTRESAHAIVQAIASRKLEDDRRVKVWQFVKQVVYLCALVGAYLFYYFLDKLVEATSLPGLGF